MRKLTATALALLVCAPVVISQKLEHFDVALFAMNRKPDSLWHPFAPRFLTAFNPTGYNNQPHFVTPHELYMTVQLPADTTQTDIYALNVLLGTTARVTATTTAEYSPTILPGGKRFSVVRVETNGDQRLWSFPLDRSDNGQPVLPAITNVGYHCWMRDTLLALFLVGKNDQPHALAIIGTGQQQLQRVASSIGRALHRLSNGRLAFVQKATEQTWYIKTYDPVSKATDILVKTPPGVEDFAVMPDGALLTSSGSKLLQFDPRHQSEWVEIADLSVYNIRKITRIAVSSDGKIAVVVQ
ncbi:MAG: hypothetical protein ACKVU2_17885 [Saprospiraceae bacterium]